MNKIIIIMYDNKFARSQNNHNNISIIVLCSALDGNTCSLKYNSQNNNSFNSFFFCSRFSRSMTIQRT
jgi:hypothetical protein